MNGGGAKSLSVLESERREWRMEEGAEI